MLERNGYFTRTKPQLKISKTNSKLLPLVLKRLTLGTLGSAFRELASFAAEKKRKMMRLEKICSINQSVTVLFVWQKLQSNAKITRSKNRMIKDIFVLASKHQNNVMKDAFVKLVNYVHFTNSNALTRLTQSRGAIILFSLKRLFAKDKAFGLKKLRDNVKHLKMIKKLSVVNLVQKELISKMLLFAWMKLKNHNIGNIDLSNQNHPKPVQVQTNQPKETNGETVNEELVSKIEDLNLQIEDYKVQVENKTENIIRLQEELTELRQTSFMQQNTNNSLLFNNSFQNRSLRNRNRSSNSSL